MKPVKRAVVFQDKENAATIEHNPERNHQYPFRIRILDVEIDEEEFVLCEMVMSHDELKEFIAGLNEMWSTHLV